ncbi:putative acyl-CoA dehydrogenase IBR3 [Zea mays]|uniref:Putative acyl-CoA dehydrogenase IBR3 n=1 Tax=Zea mays TaxID=4577 RepID=A0A1D6F4B1_MAIZE|nr:putative acyl-CoA dehydrogenase IBR3 [Zea mays]
MTKLTSELLRPVVPAAALDEAALLRYLVANVPGFPGPAPALSLTQFGHGQSNPTYCIHASAPGGGQPRRYVLRKKPPGAILQSAHAVEREYQSFPIGKQVLKALGDHTDVPVPKVYCLCTDASVIGTPFYIMEYLEGIIYPDSALPGVTPSKRRAIYLSTAKTLAAIHKVDINAIGLQKYGRRDNYCKRQVERWERQYLASTGEGKPARYQRMLDLARWLKEHVPEEDSSPGPGTGLVHGDYRPDNLVFHPTEDRVIGVIDWELSTLGNQMCDVAYSCLPYIIDAAPSARTSYGGFQDTGIPDGIPQLEEYLSIYCSFAVSIKYTYSRLAMDKPHSISCFPSLILKYFSGKTLACCKLEVLHCFFFVSWGIYLCRSISQMDYAGTQGNASGGERAKFAGRVANAMIDCAWDFINRVNVLQELPSKGSQVLGASWQEFHREEESSTSEKNQGKFVPSEKVMQLRKKLIKFIEDHIYPMEAEFYKHAQSTSRWTIHPEEENLKALAKKEGLWNLFIPLDSAARARKLLFEDHSQISLGSSNNLLLGAGLTNLEYGYLCEIMGRSVWAPQIFNCGAPDTGNMEVR